MLKPSALIVALFAMFSTSVLAQDLRVCPNVQVGEYVYGVSSVGAGLAPAVYSDCAIDGYNAEIYFYPAFRFDVGLNTVRVTAPPAVSLNPAPAGILKLGALNDFGLANVGVNYAGNCEEVTATETSTAGQEGATYCGWYANDGSGSRLLLKATLVNSAFSNVTFAHNVPTSVGDATPVPAMPIYLLLALSGLLALFGFSRASK